MGKKQSSASAAGVALLRAIESEKPESERIFTDPLAEAMIPDGIGFKLSKLVITSGLYERIAPGAGHLSHYAKDISTIISKPA